MHVCAVYTQRPEKDVGMLLCHSLPYSLETGNLTESAAITEVSDPEIALIPYPRAAALGLEGLQLSFRMESGE